MSEGASASRTGAPGASSAKAASPRTASPTVIEEAPIEVDTTEQAEAEHPVDDKDSAFEEQLSNYSASLSSSVLDYPIEHGRRYHAFRAGSYQFPNDEAEMDRLDMAHMLYYKTVGHRLFLAPLEEEKIHRILDIGTGTGIWAMEMGDLFPAAEVIGNDLSAIQPTWVPPNVKFEIDDVESPWVDSDRFDLIFSRYMCASIKDWPRLVGNVFEHLNPGGWAEFHDYDLLYYSDDGSLTEDHNVMKWDRAFLDACAKMGRDPSPGPKLEGWVRDAGFTNVVHHKFKIPLGTWPKDPVKKDLGMHNLVMVLEGLEAFTIKLFRGILGWSEEEVTVLLAKVRNEMKSNKLHIITDWHVVYGQKPE